jgi:hypothetical protein
MIRALHVRTVTLLTISFWTRDQKTRIMFFQKYLLFGTNVFRESIAHTRLTNTQLRQNQRIMELKIVLYECCQNPIAPIVASAAAFGRAERQTCIHMDESPCLHVK